MEPLLAGDPRQVGAYRLLGRLSAGGMGQVFLGESPGGRKVAVKLLLAHYAADAEFRRRFAREVAAARKVGGFHTAPVVDADPNADPPWMVTAYIPGPSLAEAVRRNGPLDVEAVRLLGAALAEGLAAIHACGLVHRDLKPGNVILVADGPRIIDFGIARAADATALTSSGVVIGTFSFMSPEQIRGEHVGAQSDVFSLGGVLAYAATGHGPFDAATIPAIAHRIANEPPDLQGVSGPLREIIGACLAKNPGDRPSVTDLIALLAGAPQPATPAGDHSATVEALPQPAPARYAPAQQRASRQPDAGWQPSAVPLAGPPSQPMGRLRRYRAALIAAASVVVIAAAAGIYLATADGASGNHHGAAAATGALPSSYVGRWQGTLQDLTGTEGSQTADLTITGGKPGTVVGTASYPDVVCMYDLQLVSQQAGKVILYEEVRTGLCTSEYVVLAPAGQQLEQDVYKGGTPAEGGTHTFSGRLSQVSSFS